MSASVRIPYRSARQPNRKFFQRRTEPLILTKADALNAVDRILWYSAKGASAKELADQISYQATVEAWGRALTEYLENRH